LTSSKEIVGGHPPRRPVVRRLRRLGRGEARHAQGDDDVDLVGLLLLADLPPPAALDRDSAGNGQPNLVVRLHTQVPLLDKLVEPRRRLADVWHRLRKLFHLNALLLQALNFPSGDGGS
jgi:hypothetical protein